MRHDDDAPRRDWRTRIALTLLIATYLASAAWVAAVQRFRAVEQSHAKRVIRLVHSIADQRIQNAFKTLARQYEKLNPDTKVYIQAIPDRAYQQWVTTQCVGGTAPDIIEAGNQYDAMWQSLATRYFQPLTTYVNQPNPYDRGTSLQGVAWRDTYIDGMNQGYWRHLTEFYSVPFNIETTRIFYNKDLLQAATGRTVPPAALKPFLATCRTIEDYARAHTRMVFPLAVAGAPSAGQLSDIFRRYYSTLTDGMSDPYDAEYWGRASPHFTLNGLTTGTFTFKQPRIEAPFEIMRSLARYFQPGFVSAGASQVRFLFVQGRAAMIVGATRDMKILQGMAPFTVAACEFPLPAPTNPRYGKYVVGPLAEGIGGGVHFCVNRGGDVAQAVDFLRYCTSQAANERFNAMLGWYPAIRGSKPANDIKVFAPHIDGAGQREVPYTVASQVQLWFDQNFPSYLTGRISLDAFLTQLEHVWLTKGAMDAARRNALLERRVPKVEENVSLGRARLLFKEAGEIKAGQLVGDRTTYELSLEVSQLLQLGVDDRRYIRAHVLRGDYDFP